MVFNSVQYAAFLYIIVLAYWAVPARYRLALVLVASYVFYAFWSVAFLGILVGESLLAWFVGQTLPKTHDRNRKLLLGGAITVLVGVLLGYKIATSIGSTSSFGGVLNATGGNPLNQVALPVGISFFTFTIIGYLVDIARDESEPAPIVQVLAFVAFFPNLLAGPIARGKRLIPQLEDRTKKLADVRWMEAFELIGIGLFQKVVIADPVRTATTSVLSELIGDKSAVGSVDVWVASIGTIIWLVVEFTGYANIARGSAKLLGIELPYNFRQPLTRSRSLQDFWRRHHLSLMAWFRDYIARPLHRRKATIRNELVTVFVFVLSGLWHGLSLGWVAWGLGMGLLVVLDQRLRRLWKATDTPLRHGLRVAETVVIGFIGLLACAWILNTSLGVEFSAISRMTFAGGLGTIDGDQLVIVGLAIVAMILIDRRQVQMEQREGKPDPVTVGRALGFGGIVAALVVFSGTAPQRFLYFNF